VLHVSYEVNACRIKKQPQIVVQILEVSCDVCFSCLRASAGLTHIEQMNSVLNRDDVSVEIVGLRLQEVDRCHVALRQLDAREPSVDKYIIMDMSSNAVLQSVLKQVSHVMSRH
jgi:hypothetical protein